MYHKAYFLAQPGMRNVDYISPLDSGPQPPAEVAAARLARQLPVSGSIDLAVDATCKEITRLHNGSEYGGQIVSAVQEKADRLKTSPGVLLHGIAPVGAGAQAMPFENAQNQLTEAMRRVWQENARVVTLLTAGHGKTLEVIRAAIRDMPQWQPLHDFENLDTPGLVRARGLDVFAPTHEQAEETAGPRLPRTRCRRETSQPNAARQNRRQAARPHGTDPGSPSPPGHSTSTPSAAPSRRDAASPSTSRRWPKPSHHPSSRATNAAGGGPMALREYTTGSPRCLPAAAERQSQFLKNSHTRAEEIAWKPMPDTTLAEKKIKESPTEQASDKV